MNTPRPKTSLLLGAALLVAACAPALAVEPFTAHYQASYMGLQGTGRMTLEPQGGDRWKYTLSIGSSGITLDQSTVFEDRDGKWRPLSGTDSSLLLIKKTDKRATYDWDKGVATWSGDVKADRTGPVKLRPGDVDALLLNLELARDVPAGESLRYRLVDDGRVKTMTYQVVGEEEITIGGKSRAATKVSNRDGDKETIAWVVEGLPVPARILRRKDGRDEIDLRIQSVQ